MRLLLNQELLRSSLSLWREAIVLTTETSRALRPTENVAEVARLMFGAAQKVDGCLAFLSACEVEPVQKDSFDSIVAELRDFSSWLKQGLAATTIMETAAITPARRRPRKAPPRPEPT